VDDGRQEGRLRRTPTGNPIPQFEAYFDAIHTITDAAGKVGQLTAADLKNFETSLNIYGTQASVATGFPLRKFGISAVNPPTEGSIRAEETDLVRSVEAQNEEVGMSVGWGRAGAAVRLGRVLEGNQVRVDWFDPATPTISQREDALAKRKAAGVLSREGYWDELGWSEARKAKERAYFEAEADGPADAGAVCTGDPGCRSNPGRRVGTTSGRSAWSSGRSREANAAAARRRRRSPGWSRPPGHAAFQAQPAVAQMLAEQAIDEAAQALLNSPAFTTATDSFAAMLDTVSTDFEFDRLVASLVQDAGRAAESVATTVRPTSASSATSTPRRAAVRGPRRPGLPLLDGLPAAPELRLHDDPHVARQPGVRPRPGRPDARGAGHRSEQGRPPGHQRRRRLRPGRERPAPQGRVCDQPAACSSPPRPTDPRGIYAAATSARRHRAAHRRRLRPLNFPTTRGRRGNSAMEDACPTPPPPLTPPSPTTRPPTATQSDSAQADDKPLGENGEKALKAEREARARPEKNAAALQKQLDDIAAANLSDLEKAQKAATDAQAIADKATHEALRLRVAAKHGISDEDADLFLTGSDQETVERQAAALVARTSTGTTPGPRPDLSQGSKGEPATSDQAAANWLQSLTRH
jgi:hypothetical protein